MSTTLEILAPYLPYGIPVWCKELPDNGHYSLIGLAPEFGLQFGDCARIARVTDDSICEWLPVGDLMPVLRSFADLCTPLPDGTVPAEKLFEMAYELSPQMLARCDTKYTASFETAGILSVKRFGFGSWELRFYSDWQFQRMVDGIGRFAHHPVAIIDYLRSNHFAVGLTPDQFIQK